MKRDFCASKGVHFRLLAARPLTLVGAVFTAVILQPPSAWAATTVAAGEYGEETWTEAGSPYLVEGSVSFDSLTVEAGTLVQVAVAADLEDRVLISTSALTINGTTEAPTIFEADGSADNNVWHGVHAGAGAHVEGAVFRNAVTALTVGDDSFLSSVRVETSINGVLVQGQVVSVDALTAIDLEGVGVHVGGGTASVTNSLFVRNSLDAIACVNGACSIVNCTFDANGYGVYVGSSNVELHNSVITNSVVAGFYLVGLPEQTTSVTFSNFWGNSSDFVNATAGAGCTYLDPEYASASDYHLTSSSPCVDSGGTVGAPDHDLEQSLRPLEGDGVVDTDGSMFDMGAYEFSLQSDTESDADGGTAFEDAGSAESAVGGAAGSATATVAEGTLPDGGAMGGSGPTESGDTTLSGGAGGAVGSLQDNGTDDTAGFGAASEAEPTSDGEVPSAGETTSEGTVAASDMEEAPNNSEGPGDGGPTSVSLLPAAEASEGEAGCQLASGQGLSDSAGLGWWAALVFCGWGFASRRRQRVSVGVSPS